MAPSCCSTVACEPDRLKDDERAAAHLVQDPGRARRPHAGPIPDIAIDDETRSAPDSASQDTQHKAHE